ncbi:MAG: penicillin acylase family protein [Caulobacter sp.]
MKTASILGGAIIAAFAMASAEAREPDVEVRYTALGVPHIEAATMEGAGYGYGWALSQDNLCVVVERSITIGGERSRSMAPGETYYDVFAGGDISNVDSDAVYRYLLPPLVAMRAKAAASKDMQDLVRGYVRGFNAHVAGEGAPGEDCRKATWFRPLTEEDAWRRIAHFPILETSSLFLREIVAATPPRTERVAALPANTTMRLAAFQLFRGGSNSAAFGREAVEGGVGGVSFSNPHYFWHGTERLHVFQLTVPGKLNVFGSTAYGLPFPLMGFNQHVGWSITHATDKRSTVYELSLDPSDPTAYQVDGKVERMRPVTVEVPTRDGPVTKTFWETRYGPMIASEELAWDGKRGYAFADPELANTRFADQFLDIARATTVRELRDAQLRDVGSPWSNITAADAAGEVYYSNISVAANITNEQLQRCLVTSPARVLMDLTDVTVLNGSDAGCAWTRDPREPQPGIIPSQIRPWLIRTDMTFNSNDSHWMTSVQPGSRLEGFARVIGPERTARGERTRIAAFYAQDVMRGSPLTGSPGVTPSKWERMFFNARNLTAELILDDLIADCRRTPLVQMPEDGVRGVGITRPQAHSADAVAGPASGGPVDTTAACNALAGWDRRDALTSRGSALFAEFVSGLEVVPTTDLALASRYWRVPFNPSDPINTPSGFVASDETRQALARAQLRFESLGIAMDAPLGDVQSVTRNGKRLPISGSYFGYHLTRASTVTPGSGITEMRNGDGYIHIVSLKPGQVSGRFLVTFSQSTNPSSPHFADMTEVYSRESLADILFYPADVRRAQVGETVRLDSRPR